MAFSRSFKNQTWFVRLPSGEIEVSTAAALERSFKCGLVSARAPVRAVGANLWTTLGEAAGLDPDAPAHSSLSPMALDTPEGPPPSLMPDDPDLYRRGPAFDERAFRPRVGRITATFLAVASVAGLAFGLVRYPNALFPSRAKLAEVGKTAAVLAAQPPPPAETMCVPGPPTDFIGPPPPRLTEEQILRLREADYALRMSGEHKSSLRRRRSRTPVEPPSRHHGKADPIQQNHDPFDPLNGAL